MIACPLLPSSRWHNTTQPKRGWRLNMSSHNLSNLSTRRNIMASKFQPVTVQAPKCLNDFALQPNSRFKLESILDQTLNFPANGVCCILLYGLYGTGKTTIARLLPGLIETSKKILMLPALTQGIFWTLKIHMNFTKPVLKDRMGLT